MISNTAAVCTNPTRCIARLISSPHTFLAMLRLMYLGTSARALICWYCHGWRNVLGHWRLFWPVLFSERFDSCG